MVEVSIDAGDMLNMPVLATGLGTIASSRVMKSNIDVDMAYV